MEAKKQKSVTLYSSPSCVWCVRAKNYFRKNDIKFRTIDVTKNTQLAKECIANGCKGVPVIKIGTLWICGFDKVKIDRTLGL